MLPLLPLSHPFYTPFPPLDPSLLQEPINCHSHLIAMLLGSSEAIPVSDGQLMLGTWQSVIMAELDGPRTRTVAVSVTGVKKG